MIFNLIIKTVRSVAGTGGNIANLLSCSSQLCLPPITDEILLLSTCELAAKIRRRELTSEQVVRAFINRARLVQPYLNAIIDERYDDAIKEAKAIDEFLKTTTLTEEQLETQKPFLGIPFTAKDSIQVAGMKWTSGCLYRKDMIALEDAPVVRNFRKAGAIPIALTNVPELLLWFASSNKLYGTTNNPFDLTRTPGGSSGGEGALMSACGSALSICSDIGGSIRMPAFHCGLFGHKPSHLVVDYHGTFPEIRDGLEKIFTFGPITRYTDDIIPILRVMAGENFHLFRDIEKPVDFKKIRIFYNDDGDNDMSTHVEPYIKETIQAASQHFAEKFGAPVERAKFKYLRYISMWYTVLFPNNQEVSSLITGNSYKINPFLELCKSAIGFSDYSPAALTVAAAQTTTKATCSAQALYDRANETLERARDEFKALLGDDGVFICVTLPRTAPTHYASAFEFTNVCCPMLMNYLGAPSTQVPIGLNEGLPFGIQVSAAPYNDRLTIAVAKELESLFGGWIKSSQVKLEKLADLSTTNQSDLGLSDVSSSFENIEPAMNTSNNQQELASF